MSDEKTIISPEFEQQLAGVINGAMEKHVPGMLAKAVDEKVNAKVKELNLDKIDLKYGQFPGIAEGKELNRKAIAGRAAKFARAIFRKDMQALVEMKAAMGEGSDSIGGYMVPEDVSGEIDRIIANYGLIRKLARQIPMKRDTINMPNLLTAPTVSWPGENTAGSDGSPTLGNTKIVCKTAVGLSAISNELLEDANEDVGTLLMDLFGEALAKEEDKQGLIGSGAPFTGIMNDASVNIVDAISDHDSFAELTLDDLRDSITPIPSTALAGSVWVMHPSIWALFQKILEGSQHVLLLANGPATVGNTITGGFLQPVGYLWGFPVYTNEHMPDTGDTGVSTKCCIFGNFKYFYEGNRKSLTLDVSDSATVGGVNAFAANQKVMRFTERVGLYVGVPTAFSVLKTYS